MNCSDHLQFSIDFDKRETEYNLQRQNPIQYFINLE